MSVTHQVLWAEDNEQDRMLIADCVEAAALPVDVTIVHDGVLLLAALEKTRPGLVVLDIKMPRLGGIDALRKIRERAEWKDLPVVIFSSGNRPDEIAVCKSLGVREVVQKPVDFDVFSAAVQGVLRSVAARQATV